MSIIVETPYVTFTITKKNEKLLTIRSILGFDIYRFIKRKNLKDVINFEQCLCTINRYDMAHHIAIDQRKTNWAIYLDDKDSINNAYCSRDILYTISGMQEYNDSLPIDLPKDINAYINIYGELCVDIDHSVYDIDFKLNEQHIKSEKLMLRYRSINLEATDPNRLNNDFDTLMLILKPKNHCLRHTENLKWKHLENNKYTYMGRLETLKELTISLNTPDPTPDQEISLYKLIQYAFKGIGEIDYRIFILIGNTVLDTVIHNNKVELNLKT